MTLQHTMLYRSIRIALRWNYGLQRASDELDVREALFHYAVGF